MLIFVYGSMLDPTSIARTIDRNPKDCRVEDALLTDYVRSWDIHIPVTLLDSGAEINGVFLNVRPSPGSYVNGGLLDISPEEAERLRVRERQYDLVDISEGIWMSDLGYSPETSVHTFIARPDFNSGSSEIPSMIPERYRKFVATAVERRGASFSRQFHATTAETSFPSFPGAYAFADPEQASTVEVIRS